MLGHIFENLLEDNKDKGAYYTPKAIVSYMARQSLLHYLQTHLGENAEQAVVDVQGRIRICDRLLKFAQLDGTVLRTLTAASSSARACSRAACRRRFLGRAAVSNRAKAHRSRRIQSCWKPAKWAAMAG